MTEASFKHTPEYELDYCHMLCVYFEYSPEEDFS